MKSIKRLLIAAVLLVVLVLAGSAVLAQDDMMSYTVMLGGNDDLGPFFVDADGMTLYVFAMDEPGVSNCAGQCAENWPPLTVPEGENPTLDPAISGEVRVITRDDDGSRQVVYNGMPLYYWINDEQPGDTDGHEFNDVWFVAAMPDVGLSGNEELGDFLVGADGMTLYTFANDEEGVSNCAGQCAENWPPLTVESEDALALQPGLAGEFGVIEREDDGSMQVTLNDMPLYFWKNDELPGDATGHLVNDVWFAAKLPTVSVVDSEEFGEMLVGPNGLTLYTFANDDPGVSNCAGGCAVAWPPLFVAADEEIVTAGELMSDFGTIEREDGGLQVTYNDEPLYYWINDIVPGDTTGHLVRDVWFVALP